MEFRALVAVLLARACWLGDTVRLNSDSDLPTGQRDEPMNAILDEVTSLDGKPNPRISCSEGMQHARQLLADKLKEMQLQPMGQDNDYFYTVPKTKDEECPGGITNLIAVLKGHDNLLKEEYILLNAHLDGPYNQGPTARQGNLQTDNSYDDGGSVSALLSLAEYFKENPMKRSLIFVLSDGEEGIGNVATSPEWKRRFCQSIAYKGPPMTCQNYPIGFTAWAKDPTIDLESLKLVLTMDPLGAPGIKNNDFVAVLGTESTPGLQELMEESFQGAATKPLFVNRQYAATSYSDADALTKDFKPLCGEHTENCLNGIPAAWFAQTAFGKYHGGLNGNYLLPAMEYGMIPGIKIPGELATFSLDMRKNFDDVALEKVTESIKKVLKNIGNKPDLSYLVYNPQVAKSIREANAKCGGQVPQCGFSLQDAINNKNAYDFIARALSTATDIDPEVARPVHTLCTRMSNVLGQIISAYRGSNRKPSEVIPKELEQTSPGLLAMIAMALDFYVEGPYRHPFKST